MALLTREQLLAKEELKIEKVPLEKGHTFVRQMNAHEHSVYSALLNKEEPVLDGDGKETGETKIVTVTEDWPSKLAACTMCDDKGVLILQPGDWVLLSQNKSGPTIDKIATAAMKLNRIKDVEAKVKN